MWSWIFAEFIRESGWEPIVLPSVSDSQIWVSPLADVQWDHLENRVFLQSITRKAKEKLTSPETSSASALEALGRMVTLRNKSYEANAKSCSVNGGFGYIPNYLKIVDELDGKAEPMLNDGWGERAWKPFRQLMRRQGTRATICSCPLKIASVKK